MASSFADQNILALDANQDNSLLITGDSKGFLYVWDIYDLASAMAFEIDFVTPRCQKAWRAHDSIITSIKYAKSKIGDLAITASVDWCCRLWTLNGSYIGSFGQEGKWNLDRTSTFHYAVSEDPLLETFNMTMTLSLKRKTRRPTKKVAIFY